MKKARIFSTKADFDKEVDSGDIFSEGVNYGKDYTLKLAKESNPFDLDSIKKNYGEEEIIVLSQNMANKPHKMEKNKLIIK